ncbi:ABC transporter substrate-binding protein [Microbacterium sp. NPDC089189]|uniref:ABC transporter substrate-binding protein n=1 Tax=Microbacterium sp. NPDC089189 TaxID=3154972 RepID=UPI003422144E
MRLRPTFATVAATLALAVALAGCTPGEGERTLPGTALTVAQSAAVTSLNPAVRGQDTTANEGLAQLTAGSFWVRAADGSRDPSERFGTVRVSAQDPLTVVYTVADGVTWSDGAPVDAADLLLTWAAETTHRTGGPDDGGAPATRWDTGAGDGQGLDLVGSVPEIGDGGRSLTLVYDTPFADWAGAFDAPAVAAHTAVMLAYPGTYDDAAAAKDAFIQAVRDDDLVWLAPVARAFREDYTVDSDIPAEARVTSGSYAIERITADGTTAELRADPERRGGPSPRTERLRVVAIPDPVARMDAVAAGDVDLAAATATAQTLDAAEAAPGSVVTPGTPFDHLDLQIGGGGVFDPAAYGGDPAVALAVRRAFLATVPREQVRDEVMAPVLDDAPLRSSAVRTRDARPAASAEEATPAPTPTDAATPADLLAQAGVASPQIRVLYPAGDERRAAEFALLAEAAAASGITLVDASRPGWAEVRASAPTEYDVALFAWNPDPGTSVALAAGLHTAAETNVYGWSDEGVDALVARLGAQLDADARGAILDDLDAAAREQAWTLPLFSLPQVTAFSAALSEPDGVHDAERVTSGFAAWEPATPATRAPSPAPSTELTPGSGWMPAPWTGGARAH